MSKQLLGALALSLVIAGIVFGLFQYAAIPLAGVSGGNVDAPAALLPELILIGGAVLVYFFLIEVRLVALIGLLLGQGVLFLHDSPVSILGRELPTYSLIAFNGVVFLGLYFMFSRHLWAPAELSPEDLDPS